MRKLPEGSWSFNTRDLMRSAGCRHCLNLAIARENQVSGLAELLEQYFVEPESLAISYGEEYEQQLEQELLESLGPAKFKKPESKDPLSETIDLMGSCTPVIYQGVLSWQNGSLRFNGRPDFLVREDYDLKFVRGKLTALKTDSKDAVKYVAWDAKLASSAKPNYLLQIALYTDALETLGLASSREPGLILGSRELISFEQSEIMPAMKAARLELKQGIETFSAKVKLKDLVLYCETKDSCKICEYPDLCEQARSDVDHLIQVAGINRSQIEKLIGSGITTMAQLARAKDSDRPAEILPGSFSKLRQQAKLQSDFKKTGEHSFVVLDDPEIAVLPPESENDIFFDMEGFPYFPEKGGLEYLFGSFLRNGEFVAFSAHDRAQEKKAFQEFMRFLNQKLTSDPTAHVYHYASYEVSALNRLAARHGVLEKEVSELIASGKLIDLYKVVKGSIMISQPSYSIKKLEAFYEFERTSKVLDAGSSIDEYDYYRQLVLNQDPEAESVLRQITDYNRDDCVSTLALYNWLSEMPNAHTRYQEFKRNKDIKKAREALKSSDSEDSPETSRALRAEIELERLISKTSSMVKKLEAHVYGLDPDRDYLAKIWLALTHSMLYYNREDVIRWRDWALRKDASYDQLQRDRKALVILGCEPEVSATDFFGLPAETKIKLNYRYTLEPGQSCFMKPGQKVFVRFSLGANQQDTDYGRIVELSGNQLVVERSATAESVVMEPNAIFENEWIPLGNKPQTVMDLVQNLTASWIEPSDVPKIKHPAMDLLLRNPPRLKSLDSLPQQPDYLEAIYQAVIDLDHSLLAIQGPPGSGKTYLGSRVIKRLVDSGKKVAVVANSHSAVENLLWAALDAGVSPNQIAKRSQQGDREAKGWLTPSTNKPLAAFRAATTGQLVGGTSWSFCAKEIMQQRFDYVFIDEAAQFSLVDALAVSANADNLVLLGDPQQLTQVVQAIHPGGVDNSALGHYMGEHQILPQNLGYFIDVTRRMHPAVNAPVSALSYQGKLKSHPDTKGNLVPGQDPGLKLRPITHRGNATSSLEEASEVVALAADQARVVGSEQVLIVAPYNAQVDLIRTLLDEQGLHQVMVGTVDKFQGREAMVVIVSMAASSSTDAPRGLEFLLDRNRLNVALSRAKANCFLFYSPQITASRFRDVEELKAISRINGLLEFAVNN